MGAAESGKRRKGADNIIRDRIIPKYRRYCACIFTKRASCKVWEKLMPRSNAAGMLCVLRNGELAYRKFALSIPSEGSIIAVMRLRQSGVWTAAGCAAVVEEDAHYERSNRC